MKAPDGTKFVTSEPIKPGWRRLPDSADYGPIKNKYVSPEMHYYLTETQKFVKPEGLAKYWNKGLGAWKGLATLYNLPTHVRNVMSNFAFLTIYAGNPMLPGNTSARKAWGITLNGSIFKDNIFKQAWTFKGKDVEVAIRDGVMNTDFTTAELKNVGELWKVAEKELKLHGKFGEVGLQLGITSMVLEAGKKALASKKNPFNFLRKLYQFEENVFKLARYKQIKLLHKEFSETGRFTSEMKQVFGNKETGLKVLNVTDEEIGRAAAKEANRLFFDYGDTSNIVNYARKGYAPFITFQYKAIPLIADWMHKNPARAFFYRRYFETLNMAMEYGQEPGITRDEIIARERERQALPEYLRTTGIRLPIEEDRKFSGSGERPASQYADPQYMTPAGGLFQRASGYEGGIFPAMLSALQMSNPFVTMAGNQFYNKDSFTERELTNDAMTAMEALKARGENVVQTMIPQFRAYQALQEAMNQTPIRGFEGAVVPDILEFVGDKVFGFKKRIVRKGNYDKMFQRYQKKRKLLLREAKRAVTDASLRGEPQEKIREINRAFSDKIAANEAQFNSDMNRAGENAQKAMKALKK